MTMQKEKLIEEVRKYSYLYDISDMKYNDSIKKDQAWRQISNTLKQPESDCKRIWNNLRESHRRALKKKKRLKNKTKKWTFEDEMSFLLPHYKERPNISSTPKTSNFDDDDDDEASLCSNMLNEDSQIFPTMETETPESNVLAVVRPESSAQKAGIRNQKAKVENNSEYSATVINGQKDKEEDDLEIFFKSIAATVKKFSKYNQAVIKSKIYNVVNAMELQEIAGYMVVVKDEHYPEGDHS